MADKGLSELFEDAGRAVSWLGLAMDGHRQVDVTITGFSVKSPVAERGEFFLVLRGLDAAGMPLVSFTSATTLEEVFRSVVARLKNGSLRWRADEYAR